MCTSLRQLFEKQSRLLASPSPPSIEPAREGSKELETGDQEGVAHHCGLCLCDVSYTERLAHEEAYRCVRVVFLKLRTAAKAQVRVGEAPRGKGQYRQSSQHCRPSGNQRDFLTPAVLCRESFSENHMAKQPKPGMFDVFRMCLNDGVPGRLKTLGMAARGPPSRTAPTPPAIERSHLSQGEKKKQRKESEKSGGRRQRSRKGGQAEPISAPARL